MGPYSRATQGFDEGEEGLLWRFWWPIMDRVRREYVKACVVCTKHGATTSPPQGKLHLLPTP